ncbi:hypothetical protein ACQ4PT_072291 [Festuca glaucescens]
MQAAVGVACRLVGSVLNQLSDVFVQAYVASSQLGLNSTKIRRDLMRTHGLLCEAERRGMSGNPGLQGLVQELSTKADEAEDALDELHYFIIQDQLDGTQYAQPDLGDGLHGHARHGRHAARHTFGNWLTCFSCSCMQDGGTSADAAAGTSAIMNTPHNSANLASTVYGEHVNKLPFDRVAMSRKIKSVIEEIHSLCESVSELLQVTPHNNSAEAFTPRRPPIGSTTAQDTLYGRRDIFEKTLYDITSGTNHTETHSVVPIVGPGGIGKTTFAQHLYNDKRVEDHFAIRVWVCASTDFDVRRLTKQIHECIRASEKEGSDTANQSNDLELLQIYIAQKLKSKRFLIVFDDIWDCNREEILKTTNIPVIYLKGLEPDDFTLFEELIFGGNKLKDYQDDLTEIAIGRMVYSKNRLYLSGYSGALAWHIMGDKLEIVVSPNGLFTFSDGSKIPWAQLSNLTSLRTLKIEGEPRFLSVAQLSYLTAITHLVLVDCEHVIVDGSTCLISAINLKRLEVYNNIGRPRSIAADLFSEMVLASRTKVLLPAAGCFQLETLVVDCISAVLVDPICTLLAVTLKDLSFGYDPRVESFTESEENALQLLTSLQRLRFFNCLGLPSLPQRLHNLSSLRELHVFLCPEILTLPNEGLPASLQELFIAGSSVQLQEKVQQLQRTKPDLRVHT